MIKDDYDNHKEILIALATKWKTLDADRKEEYMQRAKEVGFS